MEREGYVGTERELIIPQAHPDPTIEAMRKDIESMRNDLAALKTGLLGSTDGSRLGLHGRVTALENQWGKVYALMSLPIGALVVLAVNTLYGGKHP